MPNQPPQKSDNLGRLSVKELVDCVLVLREENQQLREEVEQLRKEIKELRARLSTDSHNSSKPPSSDGLKKARRTQSLRKKTGKKSGGQKGHKGQTLEQREHPDKVVEHKLESCPHCNNDLSNEKVQSIRKRQVFDIPPVELEVTEHQGEVKHCSHCKRDVTAVFPEGVTQPVQYGEMFKSAASYLCSYQHLSLERTTEALGDLYGHRPTESFVVGALRETSEKIETSLQSIIQGILQSAVACFDESGLRVTGVLHWLHVASTNFLTFYHVDKKRGKDGMDSGGILSEFQGIAMHDHWKAYFNYLCKHALCNAHHLRELTYLVEHDNQMWAKEMICHLLLIKHKVDEAKSRGEKALPLSQLMEFEHKYDSIVEKGLLSNPLTHPPPQNRKKRGRPRKSKARNMLERLRDYKEETLRYMYNFEVSFDNNLAERDVRPIKVKQKVSGCFRTDEGARDFCRLRSYISTCRKQGVPILKHIQNALAGAPYIPYVNG